MTADVDVGTLRLHPDSERVPMATNGDLASLRASLAENGQQDPIDITTDGLILDGRTRWTLLQSLGAKSIQARVVDIPERDQTHYIVDRALARRHLTADQKRALNALLREVVVEVARHPVTGAEVRIGKGPSQRAAALGVERMTVNRWDQAEAGVTNVTPAPTHYRRSDGQIEPLHPDRTPKGAPMTESRKASPIKTRPVRAAPQWRRYFTTWCRAVLPEDRKHLSEMSVELHAALALLDLQCEREGN